MMYRNYFKGIIEVITGPMFSGKSEELIKRIKILAHANIPTLVIKPSIDVRWAKDKIFSRTGSSIDTLEAASASDIQKYFEKGNYDALAIDEVQFFNDDILDVIKKLATNGTRVIVSGLDQDFKGNPFGVMPHLLAIADLVDKQQAVCNVCKKAATMTYRINHSENKQIVVGDKEYEPRCRECHFKGMNGL